MIMDQERIARIVFSAIDDINETLPDDKKFVKAMSTALFDPTGRIDSLGATIFIVALEQKITREFNVQASLMEGYSLSDPRSPFRTAQSLAEHIQKVLEKKNNG